MAYCVDGRVIQLHSDQMLLLLVTVNVTERY
jgi:hypothetical protein